MKLLLVNPRSPAFTTTPPLGLACLSSYLRREGIHVRILDAQRDLLTHEQVTDMVCAEKPDAVGITCMSMMFPDVVKLTRLLKARGVRTILGGPHPTFLPYLSLRESGADFVVCGEGEGALLQLCQASFRAEGITGVYAQGSLEAEPERVELAASIPDLDSLPLPDWEQVHPRLYPRRANQLFTPRPPVGLVLSSRGCPYPCTFCAIPALSQRRVRYRSPESVLDEIERLVKDYGMRGIAFWDDNLVFKRAHAEAIFRGLIQRRLKIQWHSPVGFRADNVDDDLLRLARESGCTNVAFGIESGSPEVLRRARKSETPETIRKAIRSANRVGLPSVGFFVLGLPGETPDTIQETIDFAISSGLTWALFFLLDVLPGSELWSSLKGQFTPDWTRASFKDPTWIPPGLTLEALKEAQKRAFRRFYLRPASLRLLLHLRNLTPGIMLQNLREARRWGAG